MAVVHISEAEAARDFAGVLARVRDGAEVVIESNDRPVAVIKSPELPRRTISESLALHDAYVKELGYVPVTDADFAADIEEIVRNRKPADRSAWD